MSIVSIVIAILVFSIIIIIHELGHFLLAKKNGIGVVEFSIGLGPTIFGIKKGETKYSLKLLPFGGMCQMVGEDSDQNTTEENAFYSKGVWQRFSVIFAGPFFNFILAFLLSLFVIGFVGYDPASILSVKENSPATEAGLQSGDVITKIGNSAVSIGREVDSYFLYHPLDGTPIEIEYRRNGEKYSTTVVPEPGIQYLLGFRYYADGTPAAISEITSGYPLYEAGMRVNDVITAVNGVTINTGAELAAYITEHPLSTSSILITYERDGSSTTVEVVPKAKDIYEIGFSYNVYREKAGFFNTIKYSIIEVKYWIVSTVKNLGMLVAGKLNSNDVGGPVAIISTISETYEQTKEAGNAMDVVLQMAYITILLSANLGVMNLLPIPALDGGKLVFTLIEAVRGKPVDREKEGLVHLIGMILLMLLMVFIFFNDIKNIFF